MNEIEELFKELYEAVFELGGTIEPIPEPEEETERDEE